VRHSFAILAVPAASTAHVCLSLRACTVTCVSWKEAGSRSSTPNKRYLQQQNKFCGYDIITNVV
jgi:hypothetical protein